jgi:hypothetical protein
MAYTDIDKPSDYFNTVLYTGNTTAPRTISGVGFQPDWNWTKSRNRVLNHWIADSVRGSNKIIRSDTTSTELTNPSGGYISSFNSDGYVVTEGSSNDENYNTNTTTYASWNWKAGTSFTNDASSTGIGSIDSTGSVNTDAGFSVCSYTGTGSVGTVKHGLGVTPKMILFKNRTTASNWLVYHEALGNTKNLYLDATNAEHDRSDTFNDTSPTSSVFTVGTADLNTSGNSIIAYCFNNVQGYSKFGSYTGNGNADGTFVYTGFKPAFIIQKNKSAADAWVMFDNKRNGYNTAGNEKLYPNSDAAETDVSEIDFTAQGFKLRAGGNQNNNNGEVYIYMAFASNPLVTSTGVPATAR